MPCGLSVARVFTGHVHVPIHRVVTSGGWGRLGQRRVREGDYLPSSGSRWAVSRRAAMAEQ